MLQVRFPLPLLAVLLLAAPAATAQQSLTATLTADIGVLGKITVSALTLTFPDADPDAVPLVPAAGGPLTIVAKARSGLGSTVTLTVATPDDLRSGTDVIPASALSWTASGPGFASGTLASGVARTLGTWTGSGARTGTQTWFLANSWAYASGMYSLTLTYTLTVP